MILEASPSLKDPVIPEQRLSCVPPVLRTRAQGGRARWGSQTPPAGLPQACSSISEWELSPGCLSWPSSPPSCQPRDAHRRCHFHLLFPGEKVKNAGSIRVPENPSSGFSLPLLICCFEEDQCRGCPSKLWMCCCLQISSVHLQPQERSPCQVCSFSSLTQTARELLPRIASGADSAVKFLMVQSSQLNLGLAPGVSSPSKGAGRGTSAGMHPHTPTGAPVEGKRVGFTFEHTRELNQDFPHPSHCNGSEPTQGHCGDGSLGCFSKPGAASIE